MSYSSGIMLIVLLSIFGLLLVACSSAPPKYKAYELIVHPRPNPYIVE